MDLNKTSTYIGDGIFSSTFSVRIKDIADVLTYARFRNEICETSTVNDFSVPYGIGNIEERRVLFVNKSLKADSPASDFMPSNKTGYVLLGASSDLSYLNYYLNTFWGKSKLSSRTITARTVNTTNLSTIQHLEVIRNSNIEPYCIYLLKVNNCIGALLDREGYDEQIKSAVISSFKTISDTIMFEMCVPKLFAEFEMSLTEKWKKLVDAVSSEGDFDAQIHFLIKEVFSIDSPILDSINRMKTFGATIMEPLLKDL